MSAAVTEQERDLPWHIVGRWQEYEGEYRANLLRIIGIAAFYSIELVNYHGLHLGILELPKQSGVSPEFHRSVTALAVTWTMVGLGVYLCLSQRVFPASLKYVSTALDVTLLTAILILADGPRSPLVVGYFLLVVLSALRFSLPLVRLTTVGAIVGYLVVSGYARWFTERDIRVPRYHQLMLLVALALTGVTLGQIIRRVRSLALDYAARSKAAEPR